MIKIITGSDEVLRYLEDVKKLADLHRDELGFIPYLAYDGAMHKGNLFVAIVEQQNQQFAGYVMLGGRFPRKKIFQLAVLSEHRRMGVGKLLVEEAVKDADKKGFYGISIKVGEQMDANSFWDNNQFDLVHTQQGGSLHPRVNIRIREIVPSLFSIRAQPQSALQLAATNILSKPPIYLLDTNILLDVSNERPNNDESKNLRRLIDEDDITVAISEEAIDELEKNCEQSGESALAIANNLPRLQVGDDKHLITDLTEVMFHAKNSINQLDQSNIKHIATAISNNARGFITRDKSILRKHGDLWSKFSIEILSLTDFLHEDDASELNAVTLSSVDEKDNFSISPELNDETHKKIVEISPKQKIDQSKFDYVALQVNGASAAFCALEKRFPQKRRAKDAVIFLPDNFDKASAVLMLDYISHKSLPDSNAIDPNFVISLAIFGNDGRMANVLEGRGYRKAENNTYRKISVGPVIGEQNWEEKKGVINKLAPLISLPDTLPDYQDLGQNFSQESGQSIPLYALENFLSTIFILPNREGAIIPIKKAYANDLFAHDHQRSLLPSSRARFSEHKSYFGNYRSASKLQPGKLLFFYQSNDGHEQGGIIAFSRISHSHLASKNKAISEKSRNQGVLDRAGIDRYTQDGKILETVFTHSVILRKIVTLDKLRKIAGKNINLVTAVSINHKKVCEIFKEGGML